MKKEFYRYKILAFFLCLTLGVQGTPFAIGGTGTFTGTPQSVLDLQTLLPEQLGSFTDQWLPSNKSAPFVYVIRDPHGQYESQKRIQKILEAIHSETPLSGLFLEGAAGVLNPEKIRWFTDKNLNLKAADVLARYAEIGGAELWLLEENLKAGGSRSEVKAFGVETEETYLRSLQSFTWVVNAEPENTKKLRALLTQLMSDASRRMNDDLYAFFRGKVNYDFYGQHFQERMNLVLKEAEKSLSIDFDLPSNQLSWPMLSRFFQIKKREGKINAEAAGKDQERLLEWARSQELSSDLIEALEAENEQAAEESFFDLHHRDFWKSFFKEAVPSGFRYEDYPDLMRMSGASILQNEINAEALFREISLLESKIFSELITGADEEGLLRRYEQLSFLNKLLRLEVTREDALEQLNKETLGQSFPALRTSIREALSFYRQAIEREDVMTAEVRKRVGPDAGTWALIAGGFHTEGLKQRLQKEGIGYAVITPFMNVLEDRENYVEAMTASRSSFDPGAFMMRVASWLADWHGNLPDPIRDRRERLRTLILSEGRPQASSANDFAGAVFRSDLRSQDSAPLPETYTVQVRPNQSYGVVISKDILSPRNPVLRDQIEGRQIFLVLDDSLNPDEASRIMKYFRLGEGLVIRVNAQGDYVDQAKQIDAIQRKADDRHISRKDLFFAFGKSDAFLNMVGRSAATYHRGIPYVRVPLSPSQDYQDLYSARAAVPKFGETHFDGSIYPPQSIIIDSSIQNVPEAKLRDDIAAKLGEEVKARNKKRDDFAYRQVPGGYSVFYQRNLDYEVEMSIDLFGKGNQTLPERIGDRKAFYVIDEGVGSEQVENLRKNLGVADERILVLKGGESVKDGDEGSRVVEEIHRLAREAGLTSRDVFVLIGGGAVLDVSGFAATRFDGGTPHIRVPSTLLAQIDAGVGVKNGINKFNQKNFEGIFMPPEAVIVDPVLLRSLDRRHMHAGMSEMVKVALMKDGAYFDVLEQHYEDLMNLDFTGGSKTYEMMWLSIIRHLEQIRTDPFETKLARPLDYGHEWGHRWERVTKEKYAQRGEAHVVTHGEGVWFGMAIDSVISWQRGYISAKDRDRILDLIDANGYVNGAIDALPTFDPRASAEDLWPGLESFRIHLGGKLTISLLQAIGTKRDVHRLSRGNLKNALAFLKKRYDAKRSDLRTESEAKTELGRIKKVLSDGKHDEASAALNALNVEHLDEKMRLAKMFTEAQLAIGYVDFERAAEILDEIKEAAGEDFVEFVESASLKGLRVKLSLAMQYREEMKKKGYQLVKRLGTGTFGDAYLYRSEETGEKVVLKVIGGSNLDVTEFAERLSAQGQLEQDYVAGEAFYQSVPDAPQYRVIPRNLARFDDESEDSFGLPNAILMDFVPGRPYKEFLKTATEEQRAIAESQFDDKFIEVLDIVTRAGFAIRDYRPDNFFVRIVDGELELRLVDRGLIQKLKPTDDLFYLATSAVLNYQTITSREPSTALQTRILRAFRLPHDVVFGNRFLDGRIRRERIQKAFQARRAAGVTPKSIKRAEALLTEYGILNPDKLPPLISDEDLDAFVRDLVQEKKAKLLFSDHTIHPSGSFKVLAPIRAYDLADRGIAPHRLLGVSTGNHGASIALAAGKLPGTEAVILMDHTTLAHKRKNIQDLGAQVWLTYQGKPIASYREGEDIVHEITTQLPWDEWLQNVAERFLTFLAKLIQYGFSGVMREAALYGGMRRAPLSFRQFIFNFFAPRVIAIPHADPYVVSGYSVAAKILSRQIENTEIAKDEGAHFSVIAPGGSLGFFAGLTELLEDYPLATMSFVSASPADQSFRSLREGELVREDIVPEALNLEPYAEFLGDARSKLEGLEELIVDGISATPEEFSVDLVKDTFDTAALVTQLDALFATALLQHFGITVEPTSGLPLAAKILFPKLYAETSIIPLTSRNRSQKMNEIVEYLSTDIDRIRAYFEARQNELAPNRTIEDIEDSKAEGESDRRSDLRTRSIEMELALDSGELAVAEAMTDWIFPVDSAEAFLNLYPELAQTRKPAFDTNGTVMGDLSRDFSLLIRRGAAAALPASAFLELGGDERQAFFSLFFESLKWGEVPDSPVLYLFGEGAETLKEELYAYPVFRQSPKLASLVSVYPFSAEVVVSRLGSQTAAIAFYELEGGAKASSPKIPSYLLSGEELSKMNPIDRFRYLSRMIHLQWLTALELSESVYSGDAVALKMGTARLLNRIGIDYRVGAGGVLEPSARGLLTDSVSRFIDNYYATARAA